MHSDMKRFRRYHTDRSPGWGAVGNAGGQDAYKLVDNNYAQAPHSNIPHGPQADTADTHTRAVLVPSLEERDEQHDCLEGNP